MGFLAVKVKSKQAQLKSRRMEKDSLPAMSKENMRAISKVISFMNKGRTDYIQGHCKYSYSKKLRRWAYS